MKHFNGWDVTVPNENLISWDVTVPDEKCEFLGCDSTESEFEWF